jgi:methionine synthase II (cobalamin-independent)
VLSALEGKTVILGVIDLSDPAVESAEVVANRVRRALPYVPVEKIVLAPDCGMKYLPRESASLGHHGAQRNQPRFFLLLASVRREQV